MLKSKPSIIAVLLSWGGVKISVGSLPNNVPFEENFFDFIFALDVLEHVEDDIESLKTLRKLLKPGGKLIITVPALMDLWTHHDELNHHYRRYEQAELLDKATQTNFKILNHSFFNSYLYPIAKLVRTFKKKFRINSLDVTGSGNFFTNSILTRVFATEKFYLRKHRFKVGVSLIMACEKYSQ